MLSGRRINALDLLGNEHGSARKAQLAEHAVAKRTQRFLLAPHMDAIVAARVRKYKNEL